MESARVNDIAGNFALKKCLRVSRLFLFVFSAEDELGF